MNWVKIRWFLAVCCLVGCVKLMVSAMLINDIGAAWHVFSSVLLFVASVVLVIPETTLRVAEWCSRPFAAILFPADEFARPPLSYQLARRYRDEHRWEDAAWQYRKIIRYYPAQCDAYMELLQVADEMGDRKMKQKYAALFRRRFGQHAGEAVREEDTTPAAH
jgi:hypothetical protein